MSTRNRLSSAQAYRDGSIHSLDEITEESFSAMLDTADIPDPDLLIRTAGEQRLSNYLLWQLAYAELYFTDVPWPDFSKKDLEKAVEVYQQRTRRFGGLNAGEEDSPQEARLHRG